MFRSAAATREQRASPEAPSSQHACDACRCRKVRCDRKKPKCTNCDHGQLECSYVQRRKRVNHTKRLMSDFAAFQKRFSELERATSDLRNNGHTDNSPVPGTSSSAKKKAPTDHGGESGQSQGTQSQQPDCPPERRLSEPLQDAVQHEHDCRSRAASGLSSSKGSQISIAAVVEESSLWQAPHPGELHISDAGGHERRPGLSSNTQSCANACLKISKIREHLTSDGDKWTKVELLYNIDIAAKIMSECKPSARGDFMSDRNLVELPPLLILEALLPSYLQNVNATHFIFSEAEVRGAIQQQYQYHRYSPDPAWAAIFTGILVYMLHLESAACSAFLDPNGNAKLTNSIEVDMASTLVSNLRRALSHLDKLMAPRLVNVQALTTLALAGQSCFFQSTADFFVQTACQTAHLMGLQSLSATTLLPDDAIRQRKDLFWTLFNLDKQMTMISGRSPRLWSFEHNVTPPEILSPPDTSFCALRYAKYELAKIQEDICKSVFSPAITSTTRVECNDLRREQLSRIESLELSIKIDVDGSSTPSLSDEHRLIMIEFEHSLHATIALVLRDTEDDELLRKLHKSCRHCLSLLKGLQSHPGKLQRAVLSRILHLQSFVPFLSLYETVLEGNQADEEYSSDVELLSHTVKILAAHVSSAISSPFLVFFHSASSRFMKALFALAGQGASQKQREITQTREPHQTSSTSPQSPTWVPTRIGGGMVDSDDLMIHDVISHPQSHGQNPSFSSHSRDPALSSNESFFTNIDSGQSSASGPTMSQPLVTPFSFDHLFELPDASNFSSNLTETNDHMQFQFDPFLAGPNNTSDLAIGGDVGPHHAYSVSDQRLSNFDHADFARWRN